MSAGEVVYSPNYNGMETSGNAREMYERYKANVAEEINPGSLKQTAKEWLSPITIAFTTYALPGSRQSIIQKLDTEATTAYKMGRYEEALDRFCHWLALVDTDSSTTVVSETRASLTSNVGACLAHMGQLDSAIEFYEQSVKEFKMLPFSIFRDVSITRIYYGSLLTKRIEYIESQLSQLKAGKQPPADQYQDGYGVTRKWSPEEMESGKSAWSWYNPATWFGSWSRPTLASQDGAWRRVGDNASANSASDNI